MTDINGPCCGRKRGRAWRRAQRARVIANRAERLNSDLSPGRLDKQSHIDWREAAWRDDGLREKNWKQIYFRRNKLHRAAQLGYLWPHPKSRWDERLQEAAE